MIHIRTKKTVDIGATNWKQNQKKETRQLLVKGDAS